jgi:hypothetical protein
MEAEPSAVGVHPVPLGVVASDHRPVGDVDGEIGLEFTPRRDAVDRGRRAGPNMEFPTEFVPPLPSTAPSVIIPDDPSSRGPAS